MRNILTLLIIGALPFGLMAQLSFTTQNLTGSSPQGIVDMNGDHLDDLVIPGSTFVVIHFQQPGGGFLQETFTTPQADYPASWSMTAGDINGDGYNDLMYGGQQGVTFMLQNSGSNSFSEQSFVEYVFSQRGNMIDIDNDGNLDAFMCHDVDANVYFMNDGFGNLSFNQGGFGSTGGNYGSIWTDFDNDGDMDCFVAKCGGDPVDLMLRNNGNGTFTDIAGAQGFADTHQSWSSAWGDFDNDGDMDVLVGSSSSNYHKLMENDGTGNFTNVTVGSGFDTFGGQSIEWTTHDFDNDGNLDIMGGGMIMLGNGDLTFTPLGSNNNNGPVGDINNDGFLDYMNGGNARFNNGNGNHWLKLATIGTVSNTNGIGARVEVISASGTRIREVRSGDGFGKMSSLNTHFGIGTDTSIDQVTVYWPSGTEQIIMNPPIDTLLVVEEPFSTGTAESSMPELGLFPNPATNQLFIRGGQAAQRSPAEVLDAAGRRVMAVQLDGSPIDISDLRPGVYVLRVLHTSGIQQARFVKE
ncbi:MAG: VCBS repeat-containing protein [Flavobacteriales bacterium]|nr:VCBS repeat-containing protein [Flavobacteriales bacterium]